MSISLRLSAAVLLLAALADAQATTSSQGPPASGPAKKRTLPEVQMVPSDIDFGPLEVGQASAQVTAITNVSQGPVTVTAVALEGASASDFSAVWAPSVPFVLGPGLAKPVTVTFQPKVKGARTAQLRVAYSASFDRVALVPLSGVGLGAPGEELNVDSGAFTAYVDALGVEWSKDFGATGGLHFSNPSAIAGTTEDLLYRTYRNGQSFTYSLPLPADGYAVTLHFAEPTFTAPGGRVFDVTAEGRLVIDDLDLAAVAGKNTAYTSKHYVGVTDGALELEFTAAVGTAVVSAIEVETSPVLSIEPGALDFGPVVSGTSSSLTLTLHNPGTTAVHVSAVSFLLGSSGTSAAFTLGLDGSVYAGADSEVSYPLSLVLPPGGELAGSVSFAPTSDELDVCELFFESDGGDVDVELTGLGGHVGHPFLHVVITNPGLIVDYEGDGSESVVLDGSQSHTHFPGGSLVGFEWKEGETVLSTAPVAVGTFPSGPHDLTFTITDDTVPPESLSDHLAFKVHPKTAVPGALARYYQATSGSAAQLFDAVPAKADFAELLTGLSVDGGAHIGSSPFTQNVLAVLDAKVTLPTLSVYTFTATGGSLRKITLNGLTVTGPVFLPAGTYDLQAKFAVDYAGQQPLQVLVKVGAGVQGPVDPAWLTHDESHILPVINDMPAVGTDLGGNEIVIEGLGFFPFGQVVVNWGADTLSGAELASVSASEIRFVSPPGSGEIDVTVTTPQGTSNARPYVYDESGPVPIKFLQASQTQVFEPTVGEWGPDGRFYVSTSTDGKITAIQYDDNYQVVSKTTYGGVSGLQARSILGMAFNPFDPPGQVRIYVGHTQLFAKGGGSFTGPAPYTSQISILEGPNFNVPIPVVTGLPTSNHDHGVNGMYFDHNGDLLFLVGGNTNAGVKWPSAGDLPESPLSGALIKARTSLGAAFNGALTYVETATGIPNNDQVFGELVDLAPGTNVFVYAPGLRNAFDVAYTTSGRIYATDNGPNDGFGPASTGPSTADPVHPQFPDELLLVRHGVYYGAANRSRGRYFPAENVYKSPLAPEVPGEFRQTLTTYTSSTDGIAEYRSRTFQGQIRGDLFVQKYAGELRLVRLSDDGKTVQSVQGLNFTNGLSLETGPGGALLVGDHNGDLIKALVPDDITALGLVAQDVTPWRAPASGGQRFVIGGVGFGSLVDTTVTFGDLPATLVSVSPTRIVGLVPANPTPTKELVPVTVTVGAVSDTLPAAFRYLCAPGCELGTWEALPSLPFGLDEVAAGAIAGKLYVVGQGDPRTAVFNLETGQWLPDAAPRPFAGSAHAAEVVGGKLYLFGGLGGSSAGKVQIYDPATNGWTLGAAMPWNGGSVSTALIQGKVYAAGGIVGASTVRNTAVYDPVANTWTARALMPVGRNHAAAATDSKRLFVFGGRDGGVAVTNGFDDVQIYDPKTNTWKWDKDGASGLAPLPQSRGGMGKAVFFQGEFFVFGGDTQSGSGALASKVYDRADVYDPVENTWRLDSQMLDPRHGIFPIHYEGKIYLPGGAASAGGPPSTLFDVFTRL